MAENPEQSRGISRRDLPAVVRRAAELAAVDDDADEQLPEEEVVRIAAELGLAPRHVRQALYEGVQSDEPLSFLDRHFTPPRIATSRSVPLETSKARRSIEDYLVTHEYLQIVRRHGDSTSFEPAADAVSKVARAFQRSSKHQLARAHHVDLTVRNLEPGWSHVRIRALHRDERKSRMVGVIIGSTVLGIPGGAAAGAIVGGLIGTFAGPEGAMVAGVLTGISTFGAVAAGLFTSARTTYRRWRERANTEVESLLDRAEKGDELRPPPSPWLRKLQMKMGQQ